MKKKSKTPLEKKPLKAKEEDLLKPRPEDAGYIQFNPAAEEFNKKLQIEKMKKGH